MLHIPDALVHHIAFYRYFKRWKNAVAFAGVMVLFFATALLIDSRMYLTADLTGLLAAAAMMAFVVQHFRRRSEKRARARKEFADAERRAARSEKIDKAKSVVLEAAKSMTSSASGMIDVTKVGLSAAARRARIEETGTSVAGAAKVVSKRAAEATKTGISGVRDRLGAWRGGQKADH
jgi:hypothetical protein